MSDNLDFEKNNEINKINIYELNSDKDEEINFPNNLIDNKQIENNNFEKPIEPEVYHPTNDDDKKIEIKSFNNEKIKNNLKFEEKYQNN